MGGWVVGGWVMGRGSWVVGREWVCREWLGCGSCLFEDTKRYILALSVLGQNLQLPAHELISPNSFYKTLNKGKLSPINY